ncbi:hypothetical protein EXIGLDRAFT_515612 [Exidia glandulosa HHB12029]|uniref:Uncharacterized protein n=1 Tax=Exidia glandulosa HHB12029 TaxID=1314781 RepID=A0A165J9I5_EXIGL|nr:hypothetical protein EXIGLDRAFT_515612 [Exidia glandulosa HHB12029]
MHSVTVEQLTYDPHAVVVRDARWPTKTFYTSSNGYYVSTKVFASKTAASMMAPRRPTLSPLPYVPARAPLVPRLPPPPPKSTVVPTIEISPPRERSKPTLPPFRSLITGKDAPEDLPDGGRRCSKPLGRELCLFPADPITRAPESQLVKSGPRWFAEPDQRLSWCVRPEERVPELRWPVPARRDSELNGSNSGGASQADSEELRLPSPIPISRLLGLDPLSDHEAHSPRTPGRPIAEREHIRLAEVRASHSPARSLGGISSDEEPLRLAMNTKLPGIASLNLPKPRSHHTPSPSSHLMELPASRRRPIAGRRIVVSDSEDDRAAVTTPTSKTTKRRKEGTNAPQTPSPPPSQDSMSPSSSGSLTSDEDFDELDDDEDDYVPRASGSKRKVPPPSSDRSSPPRKRGPGARPDRHYQCPDCPAVFEYGTRLNVRFCAP